jgi:hypothetical protein
MKSMARIAAILAFIFCFLGGAWILARTGLSASNDNAVWMGMGFYFIGKAFFVGPMLWLAAEKCCAKEPGK